MPETKDSRDLNRVRVMLRRGTTLSKKNPMPLTSVKVTELKKKREELEAKQKQAKEDRETAKIAMVNEHTTKDGEMTRVVVATLDKNTSKAGVELSAMFKPVLDLVVKDNSSTIDAQTSANRVQISMLQAGNRELRERKQQEIIIAREARVAAKAKLSPKVAADPQAAAEKKVAKAAATKAKAEKKAAAKAMTAAMGSLEAGSTTAPMERICSVVQRGSKRCLAVGGSVGAKGRAEDEKQENRGKTPPQEEDRKTPPSAESVE